ncbi:MAG: SDR family oxidoreductase [Novosphingobium sp.]|nr:SDR family oxidoreductase [Novosphingobium sp.]
MMREVSNAMRDAGAEGRIVNVASAALIGSLVMGLVTYAGSKGSLLGMSGAAAMELAEHKITVNTLLPGGVATPGSMGAQGPAPEGPARRMPPLGFCEPRDMGNAVLFFVSPAARYVTNQVLTVDAGWSVT